jgi:hypothetical protein
MIGSCQTPFSAGVQLDLYAVLCARVRLQPRQTAFSTRVCGRFYMLATAAWDCLERRLRFSIVRVTTLIRSTYVAAK